MKKIIFLLLFVIASLFSITIQDATVINLMEVKGVGEKTADKIVAYRDSHKLNSIDDLINVKGVGKRKLERIKAYFDDNSESALAIESDKSEIDLTKYD